MDRIDRINEEEVAFEWEISSYPNRKQVQDLLSPYKKLYDTATEFLDNSKLWLSSQLGLFDPDMIDSEVSAYYRNMIKLEKSFEEPGPKQIAEEVRIKVDEFKTYLPIIQTLGNPGLKERHWAIITDLTGIEFVLNEQLTLAKVLEMNLYKFVPKFATISEAASKENHIEKVLKKLINDWDNQYFAIHPYRYLLNHFLTKQ